MSFIDFLKEQIRPCVFCYPSPKILATLPQYSDSINEAFSQAQKELPYPIRPVFNNSDEQLSVLHSKLVTVREQELFEIFSNQKEIKPIELIREYFFNQEYFNRNFFPDLPIGILVLSLKQEEIQTPSEILNRFKSWGKKFTKNIKIVRLHLPSNNVQSPILKWLLTSIVPIYESFVKFIEQKYEEQWKGIPQRVAAFFGAQDEPLNSILDLKLYGDLCLQKGNFFDAISIYQKVLSNATFPSLKEQSHFCIVICNILSQQVNENTLSHILKAKALKTTYNTYLLYTLTEFYIRTILNDKPIEALTSMPVPRLQKEKQCEQLFKPFILDQRSLLAEKHHTPLFLSEAAYRYRQIGALVLAGFCYKSCLECFNGQNWPYLSQPLAIKALTIIMKTNINTLDIIADVMNSVSLPYSSELADVIKSIMSNPSDDNTQINPQMDIPLPCGFIHAKITKFEVKGFPGVVIPEIRNEWNVTAEKMFGAYKRQTFYSYNSMVLNQCCVGEEAEIEVMLHFFADIDIINLYLLTNGPVEIEQKKVSPISTMYIRTANLKFIPKNSGSLEIYGLGFEWKGICNIECQFKHLPLKLTVLEPAAKVDFTFSEVCNRVVVGQYFQIEAIAQNRSYDLDSFSLLIKGDVNASLIDPEIEDVFGQSKMAPLKAHEERRMKIGVHIDKVGKYKLILIFPYWSKKHPPPRYGLKIYDFKVFPTPELHIERSISSIQVFTPEYSWALGFTGPFPSINQHLLVVNGRLCLFDLVSIDNTSNENNTIDLPKYCTHFIEKRDKIIEENKHLKKFRDQVEEYENTVYFWYQNHYGIIETKLAKPKTPVSIAISKNNEEYVFSITNLRNKSLSNLIFLIGDVDSTNNSIFVCGITKKVIGKLDVGETVAFKSHFLMLQPNSQLSIKLLMEQDIYDFSVYTDI